MKFVVVLSLLTLVVAGCKKKDAGKPRSELIPGTWKLSAVTAEPGYDVNNDSIPDTNIYAVLRACDKDDLLILESGGTGRFDEGPTKCDPDDDQFTPITWSLSSDNSKITAGGQTFSIVQLDNSTLKLTDTVTQDDATITVTITYIR